MARRRNRARQVGKTGAQPVRFENLDGSPDERDDEYVDPLDSAPGEAGEDPEEEDPRADDPFSEDDDDEVEIDDVSVEVKHEDAADDKEDAAAAAPPAPDPRDAELVRLRQELEESRRTRGQTEQSLREARAKQIDGELAATRVSLKTALEDGDTDKQIELNERLGDLKAERRGLGEAPQKQEERQPAAEQPVRAAAQNEAARAWMAGKGWINDPAHQRETEALIEVAQHVSRDGFDPAATEYYEEVERRMKRRHPTLFPTETKPATAQRRQPANQRVGRVSRDDPPRPNGGSRRVVLTQEDIHNMKRFGLDTNDKAVVEEYARNKVTDDADARR